jgi:ABC-type branched-subunit amino acid transport system ATPase component/branched-subunit amino acid ABC-type transport system permease component
MVEFFLLGLGAGAVYALIGQGIVLIYRGSGVLNLAQGAMAMLAAYVSVVLEVSHGWSKILAIAVSIALVTLIGMVFDSFIIRRIRKASPLTRLTATLGLFLVIYAFALLAWPNLPAVVPSLFPQGPIRVLGGIVPQNQIWTLGAAVILTIGLWALWRFSRIGWIAEAVAENERAVSALGWSTRAISLGTWACGSALAAVAGILIAPITQLNVDTISLIVVPGLAAALIGGFRSFPLTLLGGLGIGAAQSEVGDYVHITGASSALPFLIIAGVLVVAGSSLPLRGYVFDRPPSVGTGRIRPKFVLGSTVAAIGGLLIITSPDWLSAIAATFAIAVILLSVVVIVGYGGQLSLAQFALAGLGALLTAQLVANGHWPFVPALVVGVLGAAGAGLVVALPALRTRGVNLAVVTLGLGVAIEAAIFNQNTLAGGIDGLNVSGQTIFGWSIDGVAHPGHYAVFAVIIFVVAALFVANLRRGQSGRRLLAVRDNERAAAAAGINVYAMKLQAFAVSGALAGLGGIVLSFQSSSVTFLGYTPLNSILAVATTVIGGVGYIFGSLIGAQLWAPSWGSIISLHWSSVNEYLPLIGGALLLVNLVAANEGIAETLIGPFNSLARKFRRTRVEGLPATHSDALEGEFGRVVPKVLDVKDLTVRFGGVVAVNSVSLNLQPGRVLGLIGPNGAGKTSLMDAVTGFVNSTGGVSIDGRSIARMAPYRRARAGMTRSFQALELFPDLTVFDNLLAASEHDGIGAWIRDLLYPRKRKLSTAAAAAVDEFKLSDCLDRKPQELPFGQRRLVAIARALASEPSIVLLDEPVAGLDESETTEFGKLVRRLADRWGMAILVIEHDMGFIMDVCDEIVVMDFGKLIAQGTPAEIRSDQSARIAYLGQEVPDPSTLGAEGSGAASNAGEQ